MRAMKRRALSWAHKVVSKIQKKIEKELSSMEPFTAEDRRDEVLNRYPY